MDRNEWKTRILFVIIGIVTGKISPTYAQFAGDPNMLDLLNTTFSITLSPFLASGIPDADVPPIDPYNQNMTEFEVFFDLDHVLFFDFFDVDMSGYSSAILEDYYVYNWFSNDTYYVYRTLTGDQDQQPYFNASYSLRAMYYGQTLLVNGTISITAPSIERSSTWIVFTTYNATGSYFRSTTMDVEWCSYPDAVMEVTGLDDDLTTMFHNYNDEIINNVFCGALTYYVTNPIGEILVFNTIMREAQNQTTVL
jgi:hypothetical protein